MLVLEEARNGELTIFFGYCAGVGKTFSMLNTAQQKSVEGVDVVIGYIESHDRPDTQNLTYGLEKIPTKEVLYKGHNGVNLRSWLFFIAFFPIISVYL